MKTFHEAPVAIFEDVQKVTDGDYALVHLLHEEEYYQKFRAALKMGREVILDNSLYELREKFDDERFVRAVKNLEPTYYIVPDVWKNCDKTIDAFFNFIDKYPHLPGKRIGVAQGYGFEDTAKCYRMIEPYCDMVAFNFDGADYYNTRVAGDDRISIPRKMSEGRFLLLEELRERGVINIKKPHHLLGVGTPQEVRMYKGKRWDWIYSVDTSNPVMHGLEGILYTDQGLTEKSEKLMCDVMFEPVTKPQLDKVLFNIKMFRHFVEGRL